MTVFETLIRDREPPVHAPRRGKGAQRPWQHPPFDHQDALYAADRHRWDRGGLRSLAFPFAGSSVSD